MTSSSTKTAEKINFKHLDTHFSQSVAQNHVEVCSNNKLLLKTIENCNSVGAGTHKVGKVWPKVDPNFRDTWRA